mgnify:CR=1 FL=1
MQKRIKTCAIFGIDSFIIEVESDVSSGIASFDIVGLGDTAVKESKERIKASIKSAGSTIYQDKIVVNLAPAAIKKEGSHFVFPIALSVLSKEYKHSVRDEHTKRIVENICGKGSAFEIKLT